MPFQSQAVSLPLLKRLTKALRRAHRVVLQAELPQHQAQEVLARTFGYASWHDASQAAPEAASARPSEPGRTAHLAELVDAFPAAEPWRWTRWFTALDLAWQTGLLGERGGQALAQAFEAVGDVAMARYATQVAHAFAQGQITDLAAPVLFAQATPVFPTLMTWAHHRTHERGYFMAVRDVIEALEAMCPVPRTAQEVAWIQVSERLLTLGAQQWHAARLADQPAPVRSADAMGWDLGHLRAAFPMDHLAQPVLAQLQGQLASRATWTWPQLAQALSALLRDSNPEGAIAWCLLGQATTHWPQTFLSRARQEAIAPFRRFIQALEA